MFDLISQRTFLTIVGFVAALIIAACATPAHQGTPASETYHSAPAMEAAAEGEDSSAWDNEVPPNVLPPTDMFFDNYGVNSFTDAAIDSLSTFAVDVDTGSYTLMRNYLSDGWLPPADSVRVEEYVNYFDYAYPLPTKDEAFDIIVDAAPAPFGQHEQRRVMRVGIQGYDISDEERPDVALTFIVDVSGSMDYENRLGLVKRGLTLLTEQLRPTDSVAIVVYGTNARLHLPMTPLGEKQAVLRAIRNLRAEGSTNAEAGLRIGYRHAWENFRPDAVNRIVLASDGVANVGVTDPNGILRIIEEYAVQGLTLTTVGFGMGNYNDVLMEQLADNGDGFYAYVDTVDEARKLFVDDLTGTLLTIAMDAKVQVEFNPEQVVRYRLVGYENRDVADDDFRNDEVDAGEIGAGHSVTALYEIEMRTSTNFEIADKKNEGGAPVAMVRLRWQDPGTLAVREVAQPLMDYEIAPAFTTADPGFQLATVAAAYAEVLRQSPRAVGLTLDEVLRAAEETQAAMAIAGHADAEITEFVDLIWTARDLAEQTGLMPHD